MDSLRAAETSVPKPVAIVGIATEFPSGHHSDANLGHEDFFKFLLQRSEAYERIPSDRFNIDAWKGHGPGQVISDTGAFLKNITLFDHLEFGITTKDVRSMALTTRKLIELSFLALLDSGIDYRGRNVGCFTSGVPYDILSIGDGDEFDATGSFAGGPCMIANKVSYHLDLLGPSIPMDTACSSSLTALHLAVQAIRSGDCEAAVVGGCQINHRFVDWVGYTQGSILAPDGKCKPFDASADGFSRGEGAAVIVVKLLEDALRDGDRIYASILGTGINANGSAAPVGAPVAEGQADAMKRAYRGLKRKPNEVNFVELHATGTAAGDPIEANWVGKTFQRGEELLVGSVKGNIGHLEIAAFLASLSKVCSIFKHGVIPPNVNFTTPNPSIRWDEYHLRVPTEAIVLQHNTANLPPLVSICSSGIGGSNGHAVIEGPPIIVPHTRTNEPDAPVLLLAGGLTPRSAAAIADDLDQLTPESPDLLSIATIWGRRFRQMTWRTFSIRLPDRSKVNFAQPMLAPRSKPLLVFVMTGQGPQHLGMGRQLFRTYPVYRESILSMDRVYQNVTGQSIIQKYGLFAEIDEIHSTPPPDIWPMTATLPALAMCQMALIDLLRSIGIQPGMVVGHSAGETTMLYASGASSRAMALELAIARGEAMGLAAHCGGTMAAMSCTASEAEQVIKEAVGSDAEGKLEIACFNAVDAVTLSGLETAIDEAINIAHKKGFFARKLRTQVPVHSSLMEICRSRYLELVEAVFARYPGELVPQIPTSSTLTGDVWEKPFSAEYFWNNARQPVRFEQAMTSILDRHPTATCLEISPHSALSPYITKCGASPGAVLCPMRRSKIVKPYDEACNFLTTLGQLAMLGHNSLDIAPLTGCSFSVLDLRMSPYPFAPKHIPYHSESSRMVHRSTASRNGPLNRIGLRVSAQTHPDIAEHVIRGEPIMPASGYLEMAFEYGARELRDVQFRSMMALPSEKALHVDVEADSYRWTVSSRLSDSNDTRRSQGSRLHADGYMSLNPPDNDYDILDLEAIRRRCTPFNTADFYGTINFFAQYGPLFQRITECFKGVDEVLTEVRAADEDLRNWQGYVLHPAILDACLHVMVHPAFTGHGDRSIYFLPSRIASVVLHTNGAALPEIVYTHAVFRSWKPDRLLIDFMITDAAGQRICTLTGFEVARHEMSMAPITPSVRYDCVYQPVGVVFEKSELVGTFPGDPRMITLPFVVLYFALTQEMELQKQLREIDFDKVATIWICACSEMNAAAARGFSRSLRKELFKVQVRLITFDAIWTSEQRLAIIERLALVEELEVHVDRLGRILAPKLLPLPSPSLEPLKPDAYWVYSETGLEHPCLPSIADQQVLVHISRCAASGVDAGLWGFSGHVVETAAESLPIGTTVVGVAHTPLANYVRVHEGYVCGVADAELADNVVGAVLPVLVASLAVSAGAIEDPRRLHSRHILITDNDRPIGQSLLWTFECLGIRARSISSKAYFTDLSLISSSDVIISGFTDAADVQLLRHAASPSTQLFFWRDAVLGLRHAVSGDPWVPRDALQRLLPKLSCISREIAMQSVEPSRLIPEGTKVNSSALFNHDKTYVLLGGIGSLGIHCALWMYQNGARNIVLTSRSGKESLTRRKNTSALHMLSYLQSLPDLNLRLDICDSTSVTTMKMLFKSIVLPVGGVIMLSARLSDRSFDGHTAETYREAFHVKQGTVAALLASYPCEQLDFLVATSSATIFGGAGQTNYASVNTLVDEVLRPYRNAFSIVSPALTDSTTIAQTEDILTDPRYNHLAGWAMSSRQICECIGDGIRMLKRRHFWLYVPDFNWYIMQRDFGGSSQYDHLVTVPETTTVVEEDGSVASLQELVLGYLDVDAADFTLEVPFTSYGLDSLTAGRLSFALKPYISMTAVQLLADISFNDLMKRIYKSQCQ